MIRVSVTAGAQLALQPIAQEDHKALFALMQEIYPPVYAYLWHEGGSPWYLNYSFSPGSLAKDLADPNSHYHFVAYNGQVVGIYKFILGVPVPGQPQSRAIKLQRLYLSPATQGTGIGTQLVEWLANTYRATHDEIWLEVMAPQAIAIRFYEKLGFRQVGSTPIPFELMKEEYRTLLIMAKGL